MKPGDDLGPEIVPDSVEKALVVENFANGTPKQ